MARPSVNEERKEQILSAYERCIARHGVAGATLKAIAEEAELARPLVRHHVGNHSDLLNNALERFVNRMEESFNATPTGSITSIENLIELLFNNHYSDVKQNDILIASAFIIAAQSDNIIQKTMTQWMEMVKDWFENHLEFLFPDSDKNSIKIVSTGIIGIYFNVDALTPLGDIKDLRESSRKAAKILLNSLQTIN